MKKFKKVEPPQYRMWTDRTDWVIASSLEGVIDVIAEQYGYDSADDYKDDRGDHGYEWEPMQAHELFRMCDTDGEWCKALDGIVPRPPLPHGCRVIIVASVREWINYLGHKPQFVASTEW